MPRISIKNQLSFSQKILLLKLLEKIGKQYIDSYIRQNLLYPLSKQELQDKEFLSRLLLLTAILDQQAESLSARNTVIQLYKAYGSNFFFNPKHYISELYEIINFVKQYYKPKTRVLKIKAEGLIILRVGGYLLTLLNICQRYGSLLDYLSKSDSPRDLLHSLLNDPLMRGLLYEKAARMYTGWISHPNLWINLSDGRWDVSEIPMVVNGHVCKVLARTGFLPDVLVENVETTIVQAENERNRIEKSVREIYPEGDYFMIDFGAFYVGITYSDERNPRCKTCPITGLCAKNTQFRAY